MRYALSVVALAALAGSAPADVTLSATMTVDNTFEAFVSTDPTAAGDLFLSGANWPSTFVGSYDMSAAGTYYLHVRAVDLGSPEMFIGSFTLSNTDATFVNGTQALLTNATDWSAAVDTWGGADIGVTDLGPNGIGPWGNFPAMGSARFIWGATTQDVVYFSTPITVVPAPGVLASVTGVMALAWRRRRA